jgi:hypothetical protein
VQSTTVSTAWLVAITAFALVRRSLNGPRYPETPQSIPVVLVAVDVVAVLVVDVAVDVVVVVEEVVHRSDRANKSKLPSFSTVTPSTKSAVSESRHFCSPTEKLNARHSESNLHRFPHASTVSRFGSTEIRWPECTLIPVSGPLNVSKKQPMVVIVVRLVEVVVVGVVVVVEAVDVLVVHASDENK